MAVVTKYGTGYKDPAALKAVDAVFAEARMMAILSQVAIANGDSATSILYVGRVPSNAIIHPDSRGDWAAITGLTSVSLGFAGAASALMSAVNVTAGGFFSAFSAVAVANYNQKAWQLAGLTSDPGGMLDVFLTLNTAATAAGVATFKIPYSRK